MTTTQKQKDGKVWNSSLFSCFDSFSSLCFCCISLPCPSIGYGLNYSLGSKPQNEALTSACIMPCCVHLCCDGAVSAITQSLHLGLGCHLPLGCILRQNHRQMFAGHDTPQNESFFCSLLTEIFCWSCSLAQVRREILHRQANDSAFHLDGYPYIGVFHEVKTSNTQSV